VTQSSKDEDDESDLQQLDDQAEPDEEEGKVILDDISQADLMIQEALLVEDLLGVLIVSLDCEPCHQKNHLTGVPQGVEGQFIRIDGTAEPDAAQSGDFSGPSYTIDSAIGKPVALRLHYEGVLMLTRPPVSDPPLRELTYKIVKLATYHDSIQSFVEAYSHLNFGLTSHALCSGIRDFIKVSRLLLNTALY